MSENILCIKVKLYNDSTYLGYKKMKIDEKENKNSHIGVYRTLLCVTQD